MKLSYQCSVEVGFQWLKQSTNNLLLTREEDENTWQPLLLYKQNTVHTCVQLTHIYTHNIHKAHLQYYTAHVRGFIGRSMLVHLHAYRHTPLSDTKYAPSNTHPLTTHRSSLQHCEDNATSQKRVITKLAGLNS